MVKKIKSGIMLMLMIGMFLLHSIPIYAASTENGEYAYLYFYTIDGDEIEDLQKKIRVTKGYTLKNPDKYKYIVYKDDDGTVIRGDKDDIYDTVTGIEWWDETDPDKPHVYKSGENVKFTAGEHYLRVHTDNPALTGENVPLAGKNDMVYLSFYGPDGESITKAGKHDDESEYAYDTEITVNDTYTFPDPSEYYSNGIYWACTDDTNGTTKQYLFKAGEKAKFKNGAYDFYVATSDPVTISFAYPIGDLIADDHEPGDSYGQEITAKVGDTITLYRSPGAIVWGCTFKGWEIENGDDDKVYTGGASYRIMNNQDVRFTMVYEEDDNWDPYAKDMNGDMSNNPLMNSSENVNKTGGTGYDTYIDANGQLKTRYTPKRVNENSVLNGVPSTIKQDENFTSLKPDGDPHNPDDYELDKYGNRIENSEIENIDMGDVLRQDNSAQYMDVYGNSMIYHSELSRIDDMCVAWIRLYEMKNSVPSFAAMIKDWDQEEINRFEAIEFALLSQEYPGKSGSIYSKWNSDDPDVVSAKAKGTEYGLTTDARLPEWKEEYMSEQAFNMLKYTKPLFGGWCDSYNDGVYELYSGQSGNGIEQVSKNENSMVKKLQLAIGKNNPIRNFRNPFVITAHAEENDIATAKQYGTSIVQSLDNESQVFRRQYFDKNKLSRYSAYSFGLLSGLSAEATQTLQTVYNYLISHGFSPAMAAGVCGNIWQECTFNYKLGLSGGSGSAAGLIQWMGTRKTNLIMYATAHGSDASDLNMQLDFMMSELNSGYLKRMNAFIGLYAPGQSTSNVTSVELATDAWCAVVEGCTCENPKTHVLWHNPHNAQCAVAANNISYQHLASRRNYAMLVDNAHTSSLAEGDGINTPLVAFAKTLIGTPYVWGGSSPSGFDCSGFVRYVYSHFGYTLSGGSATLANTAGMEVPLNPSMMLPGDLIFYTNSSGTVNHVVIYIGNGMIIGANGKPTKRSANGGWVIGEKGEGTVNAKKYDYRNPFKARRCFDLNNTAVYGTGEVQDSQANE